MAISITSPVYSARLESIYSSQISTLLAASSSILEKSDIANSFTTDTATASAQSAAQLFDEPQKSQNTSSSQQSPQNTQAASSSGSGNQATHHPDTDADVYSPASAAGQSKVYTSSAPTAINVTA